MKAHLDLISGIAGDMFLAACLDAGLALDEVTDALSSLRLSSWSFKVTRQTRGGLAGTHVHVQYAREHVHRHLSDILELIAASSLPAPVQERAGAIFRALAEAEAIVHGTTPDHIHFHEVGAVDAIIDICGAAFAHWRLGLGPVTGTPVPSGSGLVTCAHGIMAVPVPAVVELCRRHGIPIRPDPTEAELVTPTGAAILGNIATGFGAMALNRIDRVGYGLGTRQLPGRANAVRLLIEDTAAAETAIRRETVSVLTTHIDDMNPEWFGLLSERLFAKGALDVACAPIYMKKSRPATRLEVICRTEAEDELAREILENTTALGVRTQQVPRQILAREKTSVATPWGPVGAVVANGIVRIEYEDLAALARAQGWSLPEAYQRVFPLMAPARAEGG